MLNLYCTLLSQVVELPNQPGSIRERIAGRIYEIAERYGKEGFKCPSKTVLSFTILRELMHFFDYYHAKQYNLAFEVLKDLRIIPLQPDELEERVSNFKRYNYDVSKVMPNILLATMNMLFDQYQKLKSSELLPNCYPETGTDKVWLDKPLILYLISVNRKIFVTAIEIYSKSGESAHKFRRYAALQNAWRHQQQIDPDGNINALVLCVIFLSIFFYGKHLCLFIISVWKRTSLLRSLPPFPLSSRKKGNRKTKTYKNERAQIPPYNPRTWF